MRVPSQSTITAAAALSASGRYSMIWLVGAALGLLFGYDKSGFAFFLLAIAAEWIFTNGPVKLLFRRERPDNAAVLPMIPDWLHPPRSSSFPSGHSAAASFATVIWWVWSPVTGLICGAFAVLMGLSRIVLRAHHPTDVAAGLVWGALLGGLALAVFGDSLPG